MNKENKKSPTDKIFSIIIPVYNVSKYINKSVHSVLSQNVPKELFEIMLVDDGSLDDSGSKCDILAEQHPDTIKVLHKKNEGLGFARNSGVELAVGKYIIFLDSDDYWKGDDTLSKFKDVINKENPDVIVFKNCIFDEVKNCFFEPKQNLKNIINLEEAIKKEYYDFSAWNKVIKRSLIGNKELLFKKGISEDMLWSFNILLYAGKISFVFDKSIYVYRKGRAGSLTAQKCSRYREEYFKIMEDIANLMKKNKGNKLADIYASTVYITIFRYLRNNLNLDNKDREFVQCLEKNRIMLRHCANWKVYLIKCLIRTLGSKNTIAIFKTMHR